MSELGKLPSKKQDSDRPERILDAWTVLEVLSPHVFRREEELAGGDRGRLVRLQPGPLPWVGPGESPKPGYRLYYQVILGTIDFEKAIGRLLERYSDLRPERPPVRGEAIVARLTLDREGRLVDDPAAALSSFAWALQPALGGDLASLAGWPEAERNLVQGLDALLRRRGKAGVPAVQRTRAGGTPVQEGAAGPEGAAGQEGDDAEPPLDWADFEEAWTWLTARLELPPELVRGPRFAIRCQEWAKNGGLPETPLLNSFFLKDLQEARRLCAAGQPPAVLAAYLGGGPERPRQALLEDDAVLEAAVAPRLMPPARWPGAGRHSLVLLQQAAVNLGVAELKERGIFAINGPPGTGKTTLLRDFVAVVAAERAEALASFDDPAAAFTFSGEQVGAGSAWLKLHRLDPCLRGFEIVVASSNNKAVENVSEALPDRGALAEDLDLRYFRGLADALLGRPTWGLGAAVLGNSGNRTRFRNTFWWDPEVGMAAYLSEAAGYPQQIEELATGGGRTSRSPRLVAEENPARGPLEAKQRWQDARKTFRAALQTARQRLARLEQVRAAAQRLPALRRAMAAATAAWASAKADATQAREQVAAGVAEQETIARTLGRLQQALDEIDRGKPGWLARLFGSAAAREWRSLREPVLAARREAAARQAAITLAAIGQESEQRAAEAAVALAGRRYDVAAAEHEEASRGLQELQRQLGGTVVDEPFFALGHDEKQKAVPWLDRDTQLARDAVFAAAFALQRAFVDAAAKPLKHNLGALMSVFAGGRFKSAAQRELLPDLWSSFFLVVPLISTTFASVERMLGDLPPESFGWLFVDEAGQASPQQAVGALMRARRAVVVGDPVQIEPVVTLPESLTHAICRQFEVDSDRFDAPAASVQTLADAATSFYAEFEGRAGSRRVGMPLLVHRRCAEPMFGISNSVAYDRLMVQTTPARPSPIGQVLGPSAFFDVRGRAIDKWSPEEGEAAVALLRRLAAAGVSPPDVYLISPFSVVAENLRQAIEGAGFEADWLSEEPRIWARQRVGTVHTFQGREAEAVILVLGAPAADQNGARAWAGGRPNLLNVAVTRAKERLYVVGNRELWRQAGLFRELDARLPR